jgi:hypothetical protein
VNDGARWLRLNAAVDGWLTAREPNAAGRMGLFRIAFAAFYLWHLSYHFAVNLAGLIPEYHSRVLLIDWIPAHSLTAWQLQLVESALVSALIVLMAGCWTRLATLAVLLLGTIYEAWYISLDSEHASVLLVFYIPLFMFLGDTWGDTYSLDAVARRSAGEAPVDLSDSSGRLFMPAQAVLVVLVALFLTSAISKLGPGGTWPKTTHLVADFLLDKNVKAARQGLPLNYLAPTIAQTPALYVPLQYSIVLLEASFVLALFGRRLRAAVLSTAFLFHAVNALVLVVTFTPVLIVYLLFIDLQAIRERIVARRLAAFDRVPIVMLIVVTSAAALAVGLLWNSSVDVRGLINLGGLLDWRTIWYPPLPFALLWWLISLKRLVAPSRMDAA